MALRYVCVLVLAAVLLLGVVSTPKGLKDKEPQRAPRIPPHFSQEESFRMKETLKGAIQIPTVSFSPGESNVTALAEFGEYIYKAFPTVFKTGFIQHEVVGEYSHLFTVQGSDPSLQPYMLLSHIDVVPAPEQGWEVPPFSGLEHDGFIYGRGTLDNKNSAMAILQALELLLIRNYIPRRSFYISLGHDEEVSGTNGAQKISALLQARGVQLAFIVDECGFILDGFIPSITKPFALLERATMPSMFGSEPLRMTLQQLANEFSFPTNIIMNNLWLFGPLVRRSMESEPITNALVRTTMAVTMFQAGIKVNVIPAVAQAVVNFRIHPAQTVREVLELAKNIVADDRVQFHVLNTFDPMPPSPYDDQALGYQLIRQTLQSLFPEVSIVPGICIGQTDSRHYSNLTSGIYRFNPLYAQPQDFRSIHGINEKISVKVYRTQVKFIFEFIQNADADQRPVSHLHEL
ncbi:N-fatty-acyl-amino acid synthase/hydrolase PM20D1 isoform X3 [Pteronotus mesoamericanus]|uniref:N-fatty-acyl-amino acid synthase/hydrolase PM20D1 isoform X3 n=1 Tax=Pteronotus mesoamericanus TaxID=1884717 RepID=UPI0023EB817F|nr:N-fatty-acyl-amino acid synthase/hydrolase PM20D1 isoform X3 [Pteronotus parnellii mesoamericanus]